MTFRVACIKRAAISAIESLSVSVNQIVFSGRERTHSATNEVFPKPAGPITTVVLPGPFSKSGKRFLREM